MKAVELRHQTIKHLVRPLVYRPFSPRMVQSLRFRWWRLSSYFPRLVTSRFARRTPQVRGFGAAHVASDLAKQLQSVNLLAPTEMCRVMTKYGSDKGRLNNYTPVYSALFKERCKQPLRVLELGLGTNNTDAPSKMGVIGSPGESHRDCRELIPHTQMYVAI